MSKTMKVVRFGEPRKEEKMGPGQQQGEDLERDLRDEAAARSPETSPETSLETSLESLNLETSPQTRPPKAHMDPSPPKDKVPKYLHKVATYMRTNDAWASYLARELPVTATDYELMNVYLSVCLWGKPGEKPGEH